MAELVQHLNHKHPLVFNEDTTIQSHTTFDCAGCEGAVSGPSFSCGECGFYLHKKCAEAPVEIRHPFHRQHPLLLLLLPPSELQKRHVCCRFCYGKGKGFFYHCASCEIYLHINCAFLPRDTAGNLIETHHIAHQHPLILFGNDNSQLRYLNCFGCSTSLLNSASYACFDCQIFFHKKCLELPTEINHPFHRKHKLLLEYGNEGRDCILCGKKQRGLFYRCFPCKVDIHVECAWPPPIIEDKSHHEHPFSLLLRPNNSFECDACGTQGSNVSYICSTCDIQVHKDCIPMPRHIRLNLHHHPISRTFFLCIDRDDSRSWDCRICYKKVNIEHGSYSCSRPDCDFVIHVKCAFDNEDLYDVIEVENPDEFEEPDWLTDKAFDSIIRVIKEMKVGDDIIAAEILHVSHQEHNLIFSDEETADNTHCNGCLLPVLSSYYYCSSHCDFILHKACAEFRRKCLLWFDARPFILLTDGIFRCVICDNNCSGFSYKLEDDDDDVVFCLRCASLAHSFTYQADEPHHIFYDNKYEGKCNACGKDIDSEHSYRCKDCTFALHMRCVTFPRTGRHKCDKHSLTLAYQDKDDYWLRHFCDICEKERDPQQWFYHCESCDNAMHRRCVLEKYPFIKAGTKYTYEDHLHPLTFFKNIYYYPQCIDCGEPCQDLALECLEHGCNYIVHWSCIGPSKYVYTDDDSSSDNE